MGEREDDGQEEEGHITDLPSAIAYLNEGMERLQDLIATTKDLWDEVADTIRANQGRHVHPSDPDAESLAYKLAHNIYNVERLLPLISAGSYDMAKVCWDWVCAPDIQSQLTVERLQESTGIPWKHVDLGEFVIFTPEVIEVPDDISELDGE